jgi:guanidinopropionase
MDAEFFLPVTGTVMPRFAGIATFMRLPYLALDDTRAAEVDIALLGVPWDGGTTNRAGARHGPRQIRDLSTLARNVNRASGIGPFDLCRCADVGDAPVNPVDLLDTLQRVEDFVAKVHAKGMLPLVAGGDHLITLPVMRAITRTQDHTRRPLGMVHFDAHTDTWDRYFGGSKYTHGTPFRRAIEEGLLDPKRTVQIGIRGALYNDTENDWGTQQGVRVIDIDEYHRLGVAGVLAEARRIVGTGPTYVSFDVDFLDPVYAPGTGTPEIGGATTYDAQQLVRGLQGLNLVGGDVVEVSPPFDPSGNTALVGMTMMFEILCVLADAHHRRRLQTVPAA